MHMYNTSSIQKKLLYNVRNLIFIVQKYDASVYNSRVQNHLVGRIKDNGNIGERKNIASLSSPG